MQHFPVFVDLRGQRVVIAGAGETALAKLRLVLRTEACITVCGADPHPLIAAWADEGRLRLVERVIEPGDADGARLFEGKAQALSTSNRLQYLVPNLVEAMFTDFPGNSGETVRITIAPEKKTVKTVKPAE